MTEKVLFQTKTSSFEASGATNDIEGEGQLRQQGNNWYRWVQNKHTSALVAGQAVCYDVAQGTNYHKYVYQPTAARLNNLAGVAISAIPASGYGWILIQGQYASCQILRTTADGALGDLYDPLDQANYFGYVGVASAAASAVVAAQTAFTQVSRAAITAGTINVQASAASRASIAGTSNATVDSRAAIAAQVALTIPAVASQAAGTGVAQVAGTAGLRRPGYLMGLATYASVGATNSGSTTAITCAVNCLTV